VKNLTALRFVSQFNTVLKSLEAAGYRNYWAVLNAKDSGVPQNRERVLIVSIRKDVDNGGFKFPDSIPLTAKLEDILEDGHDEAFLECPYTEKAVSAAYRGRYVRPGQTKQRLEISSREYANALTCVKKDSMVAFHGKCRYFTELERFRLMGFDDDDYRKAAAVNGKTHLVKQTGNSIAVPVVQRILENLIKAGEA